MIHGCSYEGGVVEQERMFETPTFTLQDPFDEGEEDEIVWGVAYLIDPVREDEVREYLGEYGNTKLDNTASMTHICLT